MDRNGEAMDRNGEVMDRNEKVMDRNEKVMDGDETETEIRRKIGKQIINSSLSELIRTKISLPGVSVIFIKGKCRKY
jgi:indolepyruvate ferredoxin oxidoreductase alpha subunit